MGDVLISLLPLLCNMKPINVILIIIFISGAVSGYAQHYPVNGFLVESGMIEYNIDGDFKGHEVFYFDKFGNFESHQKQLIIKLGQKTINTKTTITPEEKIVTDMNEGTVISYDHFENSNKGSGTAFQTKVMLDAGHFIKTGLEKVSGKTCEKYQGDFGKLWIWKGIVLKSEITIMNKKIVTTAVVVDTLSPIKKEIFKIKNH